MPIFNAHAVNNCTGATYYDSTTDTCLNCPTGYDYNTTSGKTDATQCQIHCNAGTWNGEYTQLEYIRTNHDAFIETDLTVNDFDRVTARGTLYDVDTETSGRQYPHLFGASASTSSGSVGSKLFRFKDGSSMVVAYNNTWSSSWVNSSTGNTFPLNTPTDIDVKLANGEQYIKINGNTIASDTLSATLNNPNNVTIFAMNYGGQIRYIPHFDCERITFYLGNDVVRDLVPARRNSDNVLGMYDKVTGQFYTNAGTGTFTAGSDVGVCSDVGIGYYAGASTTNYGSIGTRTACPAGTTTVVTNATSVSDCRACNNDEISVYTNNGATLTCMPAKFTVTTTDLDISKNTKFKFNISARGTFYVDCGTDGTLSGTGVSGNTITRGNTTNALYTCTYTTGGVKTVKFGGIATAYSTGTTTAAINFYTNATPTLVGGISGSLGALFPSLGSANGSQPRFYQTFINCTNMTGSIPSGLFTGISGAPADSMFYQTFSGCSGLTGAIPSGLFGNISGAPANNMFYSTFYNCSGLTGSIPTGLFGNISGAPAGHMFRSTFNGCSGLSGSIPSGLFGNLSGAPASNMFNYTFYACRGLTGPIPDGLFGSLSGAPAGSMFYGTFYGCRGLTGSIPEDLFAGISGAPAGSMFQSTFSGCSNLSGPIPEDLFAGISGAPASSMFQATFKGCSNLSGPIPTGLFGSLSGAPAGSMFFETFHNCSNLSGPIPSGLFGNLSGAPATYMFQDTFNGCSSLTGSIPSGLFGNLSGGSVKAMFMRTFNNCRGLSGYIPKDLFENITSNSASNCFSNTFVGTNLYTTCPCGTKPAATGWGDTTVSSRAICEVGTKANEHWDNGVCTTDCTLGVTRFKSSTGLDYPLLSDPTGEHNIYFGYNNGVCHVPLVSGAANNAINVSFNGETYHASQPDEIMPTGFTGQPAAE